MKAKGKVQKAKGKGADVPRAKNCCLSTAACL